MEETFEDNNGYEDAIEDLEDITIQIENNREDGSIEDAQEHNQERRRGRPKGTTKEFLEMRKNLEKKEDEEKLSEMEIRSERIKNKHSAMMITDEEIPRNAEEAKQSENWKKWKQAMDEEMNAMREHQVWKIISRPKDKKVINCKWIYNVKKDPNTGTISGYGLWTTTRI